MRALQNAIHLLECKWTYLHLQPIVIFYRNLRNNSTLICFVVAKLFSFMFFAFTNFAFQTDRGIVTNV